LPFQTVKKIIYQTVLALCELNDTFNVIHTDIKPDNILLVGYSKNATKIIKQINDLNFDKLYLDEFNKKQNKKTTISCTPINKKEYDIIIVKKIAKYIITKIIIDYSNDADDEIVDSKFVNHTKVEIRLADFGCCLDYDELHHDIQSRFYQAPETILFYKITDTCDVWSIGCVLYELLTGTVLFYPKKSSNMNKDRSHLYKMHKCLGPIPDTLLQKSKKKKIFYTENGSLKGVQNINFHPLSQILIEQLGNRTDISPDELVLTTNFMYKLLEYDVDKRLTVKQCLSDPWLNSLNHNK
jgi:serine/threonine-protein kinase SRPK3